jgi:hypothetical protein
VGIIVKYIEIWDMLYELQLQPEVDDAHIWRLDNSGQYSSKSAWQFILACYYVHTMWRDLEVLGTTEVQNVHVAGGTQKVLDLGPPGTMWFTSSGKVSTLW